MITDRSIRFMDVLVQGKSNDEMHDLTNESFSFSTDSIIKAGSTEITNTPLFSLNSNSTTYAKIDALRKQAIALVCPQCTKSTSLNDQLLKCNKCNALIHFSCSKLPSYCFGLLKPLSGLYVCERCVGRCQDEVDKKLESVVEPSWTVKTSTDDRTIQDIHFSLNEITEEMEKSGIESITHSISNIDENIAKLEKRIEEKLKTFLNERLAKYSEDMMEKFTLYYNHNQHMTEEGMTNYNDCKNCVQTEELKNKDIIIELLKSEIVEKNKNIDILGKQRDELFAKNSKRSEDVLNLNIEIANFKNHPRSTYVEQLKEYIKILELQIIVNNGQNEILTVTGQQKDSKLLELRNQIRNMGTRLGKAVEQPGNNSDASVDHTKSQFSDVVLSPPQVVTNQKNLPVPPQPHTHKTKSKICNVITETQRNSVQPHVTNAGTSYNFKNMPTTKLVDKPRLGNVMMFDGSLYQRLGHLQG